MKLFDETNGLLLLDEIVMAMPSYQKIMEDCTITDEEIARQSEVVINLLKQIENNLNGEELNLIISTICELAVLQQLNSMYKGE